MIDYHDAEFPLWGVGGGLGLVLAIVMLIIASMNDSECQQKRCPNGQQPRLLDHDCLCVERAK